MKKTLASSIKDGFGFAIGATLFTLLLALLVRADERPDDGRQPVPTITVAAGGGGVGCCGR